MKKIHIILLAAGNSERFGEAKLLADYRGKPMISYALELADAVKQELRKPGSTVEITGITVVSKHERIRSLCRESDGIRYVENRHSDRGISYSIRLGLEDIGEQGADAAMFMVCDQPELQKQSVTAFLCAYAAQEKPMACMYDASTGKTGNPCIFAREYFDELKTLSGDVGGKKIMRWHEEQVYLHPVTDAHELADIDTREDISGE